MQHDILQRILLIALIVTSSFFLIYEWGVNRSTPPEQFAKVWARDIVLLQKHKKLPSAFEHLRKIELREGDLGAREILENAQVPFKYSKEGTHDLEILMTTWKTKSNWGVMIQYDLIDEKGNTIWELGRTFTMSKPAPKNSAFLLEHE